MTEALRSFNIVINPPSSLPSWVPAENTVVNLTSSITQRMSSQVGSLYSAFYICTNTGSSAIQGGFNGGVYNPDWGQYGGIIFYGAGHSYTNNNSVFVLDLNDLKVKRITDPTDFGQGQSGNDLFNAPKNSRGEYTADLQPAAAHTYDGLVLRPAASGGNACGTLISPMRCALGEIGINPDNSSQAHKLELTSTSMTGGLWSRVSDDPGITTPIDQLTPGLWAVYDPTRNRVWYGTNPNGPRSWVRYLDCTTGAHTQVDCAPHATMWVDSPIARYYALHDIIVLMGSDPNLGGELRMSYISCANPASGWVTPGTSGVGAVFGSAGHMPLFDIVPSLNKVLLMGRGDLTGIYECTPPSSLTPTWTFTRRAFTSGSFLSWYNVGKRFSYAPALKSIVMWKDSGTGFDNLIVYRIPGL